MAFGTSGRKRGGSGAIFLTALPKVSAPEVDTPHVPHCHPGPQGDHRWRDVSAPQRGELVAHRPTATRAEQPQTETRPQIPQSEAAWAQPQPPVPPSMAAALGPAGWDSVCKADTSRRRVCRKKICPGSLQRHRLLSIHSGASGRLSQQLLRQQIAPSEHAGACWPRYAGCPCWRA